LTCLANGIGYLDQGHMVIGEQVRVNISADLAAMFEIFRFLVNLFILDVSSVKNLQEMKKSIY